MVVIPKVSTEFLVEEIKTSGHSPLKFICDDGQTYYCKYLVDFNPNEINCLAYEIVAHYLLKALSIPTPDVALVEIAQGTLDKTKIKVNRRANEGTICFGSKSVEPSNEVSDFEVCNTKRDYTSIVNPKDIVKIAMFDLWINNVDRGRFIDPGFNYNLLSVAHANGRKIMAFDHAFIFGGVNQIGIFNPAMGVERYDKLHLSDFYRSCMAYMDYTTFVETVDNFIPLLQVSHQSVIDDVVGQLAGIWNIMPNLAQSIHHYLHNEARIASVRETIMTTNDIF
ncbi:HipA family kinase [Flavobacterium sp.]|uniref:HipA family kinase n=1 Tax=Flavobacterium sp. TaxID=239 RepID=UPI0025DA251E|nr:HipA family kinase [Flavobacterium sp.]